MTPPSGAAANGSKSRTSRDPFAFTARGLTKTCRLRQTQITTCRRSRQSTKRAEKPATVFFFYVFNNRPAPVAPRDTKRGALSGKRATATPQEQQQQQPARSTKQARLSKIPPEKRKRAPDEEPNPLRDLHAVVHSCCGSGSEQPTAARVGGYNLDLYTATSLDETGLGHLLAGRLLGLVALLHLCSIRQQRRIKREVDYMKRTTQQDMVSCRERKTSTTHVLVYTLRVDSPRENRCNNRLLIMESTYRNTYTFRKSNK